MIKRLVVLTALAVGSFVTANAIPITGSINFAAPIGISWDSTGVNKNVTFNSSQSSAITYAITSGSTLALVGPSAPTTFYDFNYGSASPTGNLFLINGLVGGTGPGGFEDYLAITAFDPTSGVTSAVINGTPEFFLNVTGEGVFQENGFDNTLGTFTITSSSGSGGTTDISFAAGATVPSTVPEPTSLALFGTGLLGIVGIARRKFKV